MIDLKKLEKNFSNMSKIFERRGVEKEILENIRKIFLEKKEILVKIEKLREIQNKKSKLFQKNNRNNNDTNLLKIELNNNKKNIILLNNDLKEINEKLSSMALGIANLPDSDIPIGNNESQNIEIKKILEIPTFNFKPKEHWELSEINGWIDFTRGVKIAKSRFSVLRGTAARLERALINYMLDYNRKRGYEEVYVPFMVNEESMLGTGQLPKFKDDLFKIENDSLYLIPTAEVPLTNLYSNEILNKEKLPIKMTSYTPCFRKESGSAGRDTRGMIRQHQFDKVELVVICEPSESEKILDEMITCASNLLESLGLAHRHVKLCTGDLGFGAAKTIDLEVWLPGQNKYREISSLSNTRDFQARRAKIRYKNGTKNLLVNTLNGSSLAVGRTLIAIMENYQQENGDILIPEVLKPYMK